MRRHRHVARRGNWARTFSIALLGAQVLEIENLRAQLALAVDERATAWGPDQLYQHPTGKRLHRCSILFPDPPPAPPDEAAA